MQKYVIVEDHDCDSFKLAPVPRVEEKKKPVLPTNSISSLNAEALSFVRSLISVPKGGSKGKQKNALKHLFRLGMTSFSAESGGTYRFPLTVQSAVQASGAGGTKFVSINNDPSTTTNWASCAALFDEYRIVSIQVVLVPVSPATNLQPCPGVLGLAVDDDSNSAPASLDVILQKNNFWVGCLQNPPGSNAFGRSPPYTYKCAPASRALSSYAAVKSGLGGWTDCANVGVQGAVMFAVEGAPATTNLFIPIVTWITDFRQVH